MIQPDCARGPLGGERYRDAAIFEQERRGLFRAMPLFADHESCFVERGRMRCLDIAGDSVIAICDDEGRLGALANNCAHRGFPLAENGVSTRRELVCGYHGWRYALDGTLRAGRGLTPRICPLPTRLQPLSCWTTAGLALVSVDPIDPAPCDRIEPIIRQFGLAEARLAAEDRFVAACNWKLWVENFLECWHCGPNHPELAATEGHVRQLETDDHAGYGADVSGVYRRALRAGFPLASGIELDPADRIFSFCEIAPLGGTRASPTPGGKRIGSALASDALEGAFAYGALGPFVHFSIAVDHAVLFSFLPIDVDRTEVRTCWYATDVVDLDALTWLWRRTLAQDRALVERLHRSVNSTLYRGGVYLEQEQRTARFATWIRQWRDDAF